MADQVVTEEDQGGNWYVLTAGLAPAPKPVALAPGLSLVPLSQPLSVFSLAAAGAAGFREWAAIEPLCQSCLNEIESAKDSDMTPGYDTLNRAWLASSLLVLRGHSRLIGVACSSYSWSTIATHEPGLSEEVRRVLRAPDDYKPTRRLPPFRGNLLDYHMKYYCDKSPRSDPVSEDDVAWIQAHYGTFNRLAAESTSFRFALESATDWRFAKDLRSALARIWGGIEAVFGINSELVYRISLLSASLLAPRGDARRERFKAIKALYALRSKAVHGGDLDNEELLTAVSESYQLLSGLLLLSIERGHPLSNTDFDEALFS